MALAADQIEALQRLGLEFAVQDEGGMTCVTIRDFRLPAGFAVPASELLLRLNPGFPDVPPDMWWFSPAATRADGQGIAATETTEHYFGRPWQRWSRHLDPSHWQAGVDSIESFIAIIRRELVASVPKVAACA